MKPKLKPPGTVRLKLRYDGPLSKAAFRFNLRRSTEAIAVIMSDNKFLAGDVPGPLALHVTLVLANKNRLSGDLGEVFGRVSRVTKYDREINVGDRYGISIWEIGLQSDIDRNIDMGYGVSIWDTVYRYGYLPYQYGHPGYRYGI